MERYPVVGTQVEVYQEGSLVDVALVKSVDRTTDTLEIKSSNLTGECMTFVYSGHPNAKEDGWRLLFPDPLIDGVTCVSKQTYTFLPHK